jgi:hypothetical protein
MVLEVNCCSRGDLGTNGHERAARNNYRQRRLISRQTAREKDHETCRSDPLRCSRLILLRTGARWGAKWPGLDNGRSRRKFGKPEGWHDRLKPQRQRNVDLGRKGRQQRSGPGQDAREQYDGKAGPGKTGHTKSCGKVRDRPCSCSCHLSDVSASDVTV